MLPRLRKSACRSFFSAAPSNLTFDTLKFHMLFVLLFCTNSTRNLVHFTKKLLVKQFFFAVPFQPFDTYNFTCFSCCLILRIKSHFRPPCALGRMGERLTSFRANQRKRWDFCSALHNLLPNNIIEVKAMFSHFDEKNHTKWLIKQID